MVYFPPSFIALAASVFFSGPTIAHPGHDIAEEIAERAAFLASDSYTGLGHCAETLKSRQADLISRRKAMVQHLRTKRGLVKRDFEDVLNTDHRSNASVTPDSPDDVVFAGNASCILQPETTEGPYCTLSVDYNQGKTLLTATQGSLASTSARTSPMAIQVCL